MEFKLNEHHRNITDQELLDDIKNVADLLETETLSRDMYNKNGKYGRTTIERRFDSWNSAVERVGLITFHGGTKNIYNINASDEQLLNDLRETAKRLNVTTITSTQYNENGKHGHTIIDGSKYCVFYYDGKHAPADRKSGTKIALDYAVKQGKEIFLSKQ